MPRLLKNWLKSYIEYTSTNEAPEVFNFWTGVSTIAGALRRRVWIDQKDFEWVPNFYIVLVAPPGVVTKSTTMSIGMSMLREIDGIHFGPDSGTWQAIAQSLVSAQEFVPLEAGNFEGDMDQMACITCAIGELGTFIDFQERKLIDALTNWWDCKRGVYEHKTVSSGSTTVTNPWINMIGATTPAWLRENVPESAIGGGFASRVIFIFADRKRQLVPYPGLVGDRDKYKELRADLVTDLRDISNMVGEMVLTPDAVEWGIEWYTKHNESPDIRLASERLGGYRARKQTHIHKLAMVLSAAESSSGIVTAQHLKAAEQITTATETDMIKVFESIGVAPMSRLMQEVVSFLMAFKTKKMAVSQQMLYRHCFQIMSQQELSEVIEAMVKAGYLATKQTDNTIYFHLLVEPEQIGRAVAD